MLEVAVGMLTVASAAALIASVFVRAMGRRHRRATDELADVRSRLRAGLLQPAVTILGVDQSGAIVWNEGPALRGTDLARTTTLGSSVWQTFADWPDVLDVLQSTLGGKSGEATIELESGTLTVRTQPRFGPDGRADEAILTIFDVTAEREEHARADRLASVRHRTASVMDYHIRGQLNGIASMSEMMSESDLSAEQSEWLSVLIGARDQLQTFSRHLIDFLELDAGRVELDLDPCSFRDIVDASAAAHREQANAQGTTFAVRYPPSSVDAVIADARRLAQLIDLLVGVAVGTNPGGTVIVNVDETNQSADAVRLALTVEDQGFGLSQDGIDRIFSGFDSPSAMWARRSSGSGLELSIAKRVAELMGAKLSVESEQDVGTTFRLEFELQRAPGLSKLEPETAEPDRELPPGRVLLVDDSEMQREVTLIVLERLGQSVVGAANGAEALEALQGRTFDVVLTELHMPVLDGEGLAREIARLHGQSTPVIALTADGSVEAERRCATAGFTARLLKPATRQEIALALASCYAAAETRQERPTAIDSGAIAKLRVVAGNKGPALVDRLVDAFLVGTPRQLVELRDAAVAHEQQTVYRLMDVLDTSCRMLGALRLRSMVAALEQLEESASTADIHAACDAITEEFELVQQELRPDHRAAA